MILGLWVSLLFADAVPKVQFPLARLTGGWIVGWSGEAGRTYRLERTAELRTATVWEPVATVTATNGLISADDFVGAGATTRFYRVILLTPDSPVEFTVGTTLLRSPNSVTNGSLIELTGQVGIGRTTVTAAGPLILDSSAGRLAGSGTVILPGVGTPLTGAFVVNLALARMEFVATPEALSLGDLLTVRPRSLQIDVGTGAFSGEGLIEVVLGASEALARPALPAAGPLKINLDGAYSFDPTTQRIGFTGSTGYRDVFATGTGEIDVAAATFSLTGTVLITGPQEENYTLLEATFALTRPATGPPEFAISGAPNIPSLQALNVVVAGRLLLTGSLELTGTSAGSVDALHFTTFQVRYSRPEAVGIPATLRFGGRLALPNVAVTELSGRIKPDGSLDGVQTVEPLVLGGLNIRPRIENGAPVPVLSLQQSAGGRQTFQVRGEFLTPEEHGVKPVAVDGTLVLRTVAAALDVESLQVTNRLPIPQWPLPSQIRLTNFSLVISYTQPDFEARMRGEVMLGFSANPVTLGLDAALIANINDPEDVGFDVALRAQKVDLQQKVYLADAQFRIVVGSKPASATFALIDSSAGFFPKFSSTNPPPFYQRSSFNLFAANVGASIQFSVEGVSLALTNGTLQLPLLFTNQPPGLCPNNSSGTSIALGRNTALTIDISGPRPEDLTLRAIGALDFVNIALLPQIHGVGAEFCRASLVFNPGGLPYLTNLQGVVVFPFPTGQTNRVELIDGAWGLNGFPTGTIALTSDLKLYDDHGIKYTLLGRGKGKTPCTNGVAFTAIPDPEGGPLPTLVLDGASELILPADLLTKVDGDFVRSVVCASVTLPSQAPFLPKLDIKTLQFGGTFHLGRSSGFVLSNVVVNINNLDNLFTPTAAEPFIVSLTGTLAVPQGPAFTLNEAKLTFNLPNTPPKFTVAGISYNEGEFALAQKIPVRVTAASFTFKDPNKPLAELLKPANVNLKFSVLAAIPSANKKLFEGSIHDLKVSVALDGTPILEDVDGFSMLIKGLNLPPLANIGGGVLVSGLSAGAGVSARGAAPAGLFGGDVSDLFFAGTVEGSYQGYKLKILLAFRTTGLVGVCLDVNAGSVGIPLDAGVLGGILLTGANGGMALGQGFTDPCEFTDYIGPDGKPKPGVIELPRISWDELATKLDRAKDLINKFKPGGGGAAGPAAQGADMRLAGLAGLAQPAGLPHARSTNEFGLPCPGDCPPPTINIFCQPHPDHDRFPQRVITRFSSVDEDTLNQLGLNRAWVTAKYNQGGDWATQIAQGLASGLRTQAQALTPFPDPALLGAQAAVIRGVIDEGLLELERSLIPLIRTAIAGQVSPDLIYEKLRDVAYGGIPCPDLTLAVSGTLTHTTVSSFLSGTVGAAISSAGVAGVSGRVNVFGVPVGKAKGFLAVTDDQGDPNPSLCAEATVDIGPVSLGTMRGSYALQGAVTGLGNIFDRLALCLAEPLFVDVVRRVLPDITVAGKTRAQIAAELTLSEKVAVIANLYSRPDLPGELRACFAEGIGTFMAQVEPEILFCGEVRPRLFGFPLGSELLSGGMHVTKTGYTAVSSTSPSLMLATGLLAVSSGGAGGGLILAAGPLATSLFAQDRATLGMALQFPDPAAPFLAGVEGRLASPQAVANWIDHEFDAFLENATYTFDYSLSPLGFKTVNAQARVVLPNLTAHPARPGSSWVRPESRTQTPRLPSRLDLILSALSNHLAGSSLGLIADPLWKGSAGDLGLAFASGSPERAAVAQLSFANDYFPHGGLVGGGFIQIPRALYESPPPELGIALNPDNDALTRLSAAATYLTEYVLESRQAGALGFYVPAPNPPFFTDANGAALKPRVLLEAIRSQRPELLGRPNAYAGGEFFLKGYLDGRLLDVPIAKASLEARLADSTTGTQGLFQARATVPPGSWLHEFSPGASLEFELKGAPPERVENVFSNRLVAVKALLAGPRAPAALQAGLAGVLDDLQTKLPKVKLEAALELKMPPALADLVEFNHGTWLYAYSPRFDPTYSPGDNRPVARVRRAGGLAMRGNLNFKLKGAPLAAIADGQLLLTPGPSGSPTLSGDFAVPLVTVGSLTLRDGRLAFTGAGPPRFGIQGSVDPFTIGSAFRVESVTAGVLGARMEVARTGPGLTDSQFFFKPGKLTLGSARYLIHGGKKTNEFSFSTTGPWSATLEVTNEITLQAGGVVILRLASGALVNPIRVSGIGRTSMEISADLGGNTSLTVFPGLAYARTLVLKANPTGRVTVRSDGTFELTGELSGDLALPEVGGFPVAKANAGAAVRLDGTGLTLSGQVGGGVLTQVGGSAFSASASVRVGVNGSVQFLSAANFTVPRLRIGQVYVEGMQGGDLSAKLGNTGLDFSGARLVFDGLFTNTLPPFHMSPSGDFAVNFGPAGSSIGRFALGSTRYTVLRTNGILVLKDFLTTYNVPGLNGEFSLAGRLDSSGGIALTGASSAGNLNGFPVGSVTGTLERGAGGYANLITSGAPLAYWRLDEKSAAIAASVTGTATDGTYQSGIQYSQPGPFSGSSSVQLDGLGGQVVIKSSNLFNSIGPTLTLEAWIRVKAFDRTWNTIIAKGDSAWRLQRNGNFNSLAFDTDGINPPYLGGTRSVNDGQWHHVVATYDGRAKYLWIDGELDAWTPAGGTIAKNSYPVLLGENAQATGRFWNGWLDEVAVYSRSLGPTEILDHYRAGAGLVLRGKLKLGLPGLTGPVFTGAFSSSGAFALTAGPTNATLAGFALNNASFWLSRGASGNGALFTEADLSVPGLPAIRLHGDISSSGGLTLSASPGNTDLLGYNFSGVNLLMSGSLSGAALGWRGNLGITELGNLNFAGSIASNGDVELINNFSSNANLFGYPVGNWTLALRRHAVDYRSVIAGNPLVLQDRGANPVAYWRLGEATGSQASDSKKISLLNPAFPGTYIGKVTLGRPGSMPGGNTAAAFDGETAYIAIGQEAAFDFTKALSVEAWIRVSEWTRTWQAIVTKGDSSWRLSRYSNGKQVSFDTTSEAGAHSLPGVRNLADQQWHHVVGVCDGLAKYLYIDGVLEGFAAYRATISQNDQPVLIGENSQATGRHFNGELDEVAVYGRALSASEVLDHYLAAGGAGISARVKLGLPGLGQADLFGSLQPDGGLSLQAAVAPFAVVGFGLDAATVSLRKLPAGPATGLLGGTLNTVLGSVYVAGFLAGDGNYSLLSEASGTFNIGGRILTYSVPAQLTRSQLEANGSLRFGNFNFVGTMKLSTKSEPSFSGQAGGETGFVPVGLTPAGKPGHPYAKLSWNASAGYNSGTKTIAASITGTVTIEYEKFPNNYVQESFGFGPLNLPEGGNISVSPGKVFQGVNVFGFTLP